MSFTKILAIVGPTATGKSRLAVDLAKKINGEIISADSMQVYRKLNIATAKLSAKQQQGVAHHLIDCVDLNCSFSVASYVKMARAALKNIVLKGKKPILIGGTGLYVDSFLNGINFGNENKNENIRLRLIDELEQNGSVYLFNKLKELDSEYAKKVHPNNTRRVIRALEACLSCGASFSEIQKLSRPGLKELISLKIGLNFSSRQKLYQKIEKRVNDMMEQGLLEEARFVFEFEKLSLTVRQAIGYKEFEPFFLGQETISQAVLNLKKHTRKLAKRQISWFKRDDSVNWFFVDEFDEKTIFEKVLKLVVEFFA